MIDVSNVSFRYGKQTALDNVSITFRKGESVFLAGANGAGKTTLLRALSGVLFTKRGKITVDSENVGWKTRIKVSYIPASLSSYDTLTIKEAIHMHSAFYPGFQYREIGGYRFDMSRKVGGLSRGEKTLFFLTLSLSTSPDYLLIDDILHFLDPHLRDIFLQAVLQLIEDRELGLIIAAQVPVDLEGVIDRLVVLDRGKVVLDEGVENLKQVFVRGYSDEVPEGLPVVFKKEWHGMNELYIYPYSPAEHTAVLDENEMKIEHLTLAEILRAYIGGEYDHH